MSRNGKIARLPSGVREGLNYRLQDGELGAPLLEWLNGLPQVQEIIRKQFAGVPISKQNLSEWRSGGYQEWLRHEESVQEVEEFIGRVDSLAALADEVDLSDRLSAALSAELVRTTQMLLGEATEPKRRWKLLREILPHLAVLRREDHRAARLELAQERWERENNQLEQESFKAEIYNELRRERLKSSAMADSPGNAPGQPATADGQSEEPSQTQSNPVKPSQTK